MKSYSQLDVFSESEVGCLKQAAFIVKHLPDEDDRGGPTRCHEIARIVAGIRGTQVCDGFYGFVDHSWLWTTPYDRMRTVGRIGAPNVLDPYCVGSLPQVRLVDCSRTSLPHIGWAYRPGDPRKDVDDGFVQRWIHELACKVGA